ncbi:phosphatidate cytidylyltransferase [Flavobacterium cyanobacteriorum]|uniref:Phosphatidate cytidylyltransferase n=1 Tax=Flavobacterium cyanobacteriorum TaxID=2022802 RepID=A0A255YRV5_9FLAO|nr:phosphatidate cytidylyltransferase [Flavobacterium cyanobacteriorum]OYQ31948.1 phosphatidate cytidylyltransferase [Flavobacterium cyanobacteriorum]
MNESIVRALSGIVYIALLISATLFSGLTFTLLFGVFLFTAVSEFCRLVSLNKVLPFIIAATGYILFAVFISDNKVYNLMLTVAALCVGCTLLYRLFNPARHTKVDFLAKIVLLSGYIIIPFLLLIRMPFSTGAYNRWLLIGIFILIWTNDTFAYIVGKALGRTKLLERISPKKTVEGFVGGMVFAVAAGFTVSLFPEFGQSSLLWICTALIVVVFGTLGDLVESKFKRDAGVKDSGAIMPGHGGILDRLDSIIFAIPFLFLFYQIIHYVS